MVQDLRGPCCSAALLRSHNCRRPAINAARLRDLLAAYSDHDAAINAARLRDQLAAYSDHDAAINATRLRDLLAAYSDHDALMSARRNPIRGSGGIRRSGDAESRIRDKGIWRSDQGMRDHGVFCCVVCVHTFICYEEEA